jgi:hypothetical protein
VDASGQYLSPLVRVLGGNSYQLDSLTYTYRGDLTSGATLTISGTALGGSGNSVTVEGFTNGALGIHLPTAPSIRLQPKYVTDIPAIQGGDFMASVSEGGATFFTVATDVVASSDTIVRIAVDGNGSDLSAILGASEVSFEQGYVDVLIPAGQSRATFAVRAVGDFDASTSLNLSASLLGGPTSAPVLLSVDGAPDTDTPTTTYTILGDQLPPPPGTLDPWGNTIGGAPDPGATTSSTARRTTTASRAGAAPTRSTATTATTGFSAATATTGSPASPATTASKATRATISPSAGSATT